MTDSDQEEVNLFLLLFITVNKCMQVVNQKREDKEKLKEHKAAVAVIAHWRKARLSVGACTKELLNIPTVAAELASMIIPTLLVMCLFDNFYYKSKEKTLELHCVWLGIFSMPSQCFGMRNDTQV